MAQAACCHHPQDQGSDYPLGPMPGKSFSIC